MKHVLTYPPEEIEALIDADARKRMNLPAGAVLSCKLATLITVEGSGDKIVTVEGCAVFDTQAQPKVPKETQTTTTLKCPKAADGKCDRQPTTPGSTVFVCKHCGRP